MSIRQIPLGNLTDRYDIDDLIPQAVINKPVEFLEGSLNIDVKEDFDDFDLYRGAAILVNDTLPVALKHYRGHPPNTVTIYLSAAITDMSEITETIARITRELNLAQTDLLWQRADAPDL